MAPSALAAAIKSVSTNTTPAASEMIVLRQLAHDALLHLLGKNDSSLLLQRCLAVHPMAICLISSLSEQDQV